MKLRLAKNSVRIRVLRSEVNALQSGERLQETLYFGLGESARFTYILEPADVQTPQVSYSRNELLIRVPRGPMLHWATTDEVGMYAQVETGISGALSLLIEKDFACLDRTDADNTDTFDNPNMTC